MSKIFISYRRDDSAYAVQHIYDELSRHYGADNIVYDIDSIPLGENFREFLEQKVGECDVLLAVIGNQWLKLLNLNRDAARDYVRIEIGAALQRRIPVIPVLLDKASVPKELPNDNEELSKRHAAELRHGKDFKSQLDRLIKGVGLYITTANVASPLVKKSMATSQPVKPYEFPAPPDVVKKVKNNKSKISRTNPSVKAGVKKTRTIKFGALVIAFVLYLLGLGALLSHLNKSSNPISQPSKNPKAYPKSQMGAAEPRTSTTRVFELRDKKSSIKGSTSGNIPNKKPDDASSKKANETSTQPKTTASIGAGAVCFALGPFEGDQVKSISAKLTALGALTSSRLEKLRVPIGFWVYLPKYATWNEARRKVMDLEEKGIRDLFIMGRGRMKNAVSLGLYKEEKSANERMTLLRNTGIEPKLEVQYTVNERYWIDINITAGNKQIVRTVEGIAKGLSVIDLVPRKCN